MRFDGTTGRITVGTLRLVTGTAASTISVLQGTGHEIRSPVALDAYASFDVAAAARPLVGSAISGASFDLTKTGSGILELSGSNAYGATSVTAGGLLMHQRPE